MFFPIAEFRPDIADLNSDFTDEVQNVLVADGSYIPMPAFSPLSAALPSKPLGSFTIRDNDGLVVIFVGTKNGLCRLNNTDLNFVDVSRGGQPYGANEEVRWSFAAFGNHVIAVNKNDAPQVLILGVDSNFRDLGGNPPRVGLVKIWGDFVCLMQLPDNPSRVHWSGLNDVEWWTVGSRNCDFQDFADGGLVQGATETTNPLIFLQSAIYLANFVPGSDIIFSFQKLHEKRGVSSALSIATRGSQAFYVDAGGFFQIGADGGIAAIGFEKVDRTIFSKFNNVNVTSMLAAIDPFYSRVYWALDYEGKGFFEEMLVYDWGLGRWSCVKTMISALLPIYNIGYTLGGLDKVSTSLDDLLFSLDSKAWEAGAPILGAFDRNYRLGAFSGAPMEAVVTSPEMGLSDGTMQRIHAVYPLVDSDKGRVKIGVRLRRRQGEGIRWGKEYAPSMNSGRYYIRSRSRFHKIGLRLPNGENWHHIKGFDVELQDAGRR